MMHKPAHDLIRKRFIVQHRQDHHIYMNDQCYINFASNDYLNLSSHPRIKKALIEGIQIYGTGSTSSPLISGFFRSHHQLEEKFSEFLKRDRTLFFNSGYHVNIGIISSLIKRNDIIYADKLCHASLLDGIHLSHGKLKRYQHNNIQHLTQLLNQNHGNMMIITESIFSMEGDIAPINQIAKLAHIKQATLMVDDAHSIGILGQNGGGICEHYSLTQKDIPILVAPLGKAFASQGAIVSGHTELIENLIQIARTYRYSTALPPAIAHSLLTTLDIIQKDNWRREKLHSLIIFFIKEAKKRNLPLTSENITPIKSILIGNNQAVMQIQEKLLQKGFYIACIRPPTVPQGTARIRVSLSCSHNENDINNLLDLISKYHDKINK